MKPYKKYKNFKKTIFISSMEHEACGVGMIASTNGKKSRKIVDMVLKC